MRTQAFTATLLTAAGACNAFVSTPGSWRWKAVQKNVGSNMSPLMSSPTDAVDEVPSDVSQAEYVPTGTSSAASTGLPTPGFSLADELIETINSGVGEGYIPFSETDKNAIEELVVELESSGEDTDVQFPRDLDKLDGRWRLAFTNNMVGLGKLSPVMLRDVYQVVDTSSNTLTNVVYAIMSPPMFAETWGRLGQRVADLAKTVEDRVSFPVDFNIQHDFDVSSQSRPAQIELVQKELKLMNVEDKRKRSVALPALQPLARAAAGRFDTTFLGADVRVSRGRFGELRVFQRVL